MKTILTDCTVIDCTGQPPLENTTPGSQKG